MWMYGGSSEGRRESAFHLCTSTGRGPCNAWLDPIVTRSGTASPARGADEIDATPGHGREFGARGSLRRYRDGRWSTGFRPRQSCSGRGSNVCGGAASIAALR